jgi:hypothetical protein
MLATSVSLLVVAMAGCGIVILAARLLERLGIIHLKPL